MKKIDRRPSDPAPSSRPGQKDRGWILYVEDEDENWLVAELLLRRGYDLLRARDDREACAAVIDQHDKLTAVLMDIQLAGSRLDGIKLTRLFRGRLSTPDLPAYARLVRPIEVPIVFVTAYGARYTESDLIAAGGDTLLPKPVDFLRLTTTLRRLEMQRAVAQGKKPTA
jgi:CheY-like chemotaxis protein